MATQTPSLQFSLKYETAAALQAELTTSYHRRKELEGMGHPSAIEYWDEQLKPLYEYITAYVEKYGRK